MHVSIARLADLAHALTLTRTLTRTLTLALISEFDGQDAGSSSKVVCVVSRMIQVLS